MLHKTCLSSKALNVQKKPHCNFGLWCATSSNLSILYKEILRWKFDPTEVKQEGQMSSRRHITQGPGLLYVEWKVQRPFYVFIHVFYIIYSNKSFDQNTFTCSFFIMPLHRRQLFSGRPSVRPVLMNMISQECLEGISSNLAQTSAWTQGWSD